MTHIKFYSSWTASSAFRMRLAAVSAALATFSTITTAQSASTSGNASAPAPESSRVEDAVRTFFGVLAPQTAGDTLAHLADQYYKKGIELERAGRIQDAYIAYSNALQVKFDDPRAHLAVGRLLEPTNPALSLYHYQSAFRFSIEAAAQQAPTIELLRRFLVGRYLSYALPVTDPEVSVKLLELAASLAPEDPRIQAHLATAYFFKGEYERSIQKSRNALALGLDDGLIYTNIAAAYTQLHKKDEAESALVMALNRDELDINEALNAIRRSNESDTLVTFNRLLGREHLKALMDGSTKGRLEAALLAWKKGDNADALRLAQAAVDGNPSHSYALIILGDFKRAAGDTDGAKAAYKMALERNPGNQLGNTRLGDITYAAEDYAAAAQYYMRGMDLMSGRIEKLDVLDRTAVALAHQGRHDEALALLDKWIKGNPNAPEAFPITVRRAGILVDAGRQADAERLLRSLVDHDRLNPAGYTVLYNFYQDPKHKDERKARSVVNDGIARLQGARDDDPQNPDFYRDLARLYRLNSNEREARKALYDGGMRTTEKRFFSNALFAADDETGAYDVLKSWLSKEPGNPEAILSYGWVCAKLGKDLAFAMSRVEDVAKDNAAADLAPVRRTRSYLNYAMGNYQKSIDDIKAFLTSDQLPQAAFFHRLWGMAAEALNHKTEAVTQFKKAMQLDPIANADLQAKCSMIESGAPAPAPAATASATASTSASASTPASATPRRTSSGRRGSR